MDEFIPLDRKKKFIGGAEKARRNAKKRKWQQQTNNNVSSRSGQSHVNPSRIPKSVPPSERYFASLLTSSVKDLMTSNENRNNSGWARVMGQICNRAGLPLPQKIPSTNKDGKEFYNMRGSLVLEESRCLLVDGLRESKNRRRNSGSNGTMRQRKDAGDGIVVELLNIQDRSKRKGLVLSFRKYDLGQSLQSEVIFSSMEMQNIRHGSIFEIVPFNNRMGALPHESEDSCPMDSNDSKETSVLATIMPWASFNECGSGGKVSLMVFRTEGLQQMMRSSSRWILYPVVALISEQRQFIACCDAKKVAFLPKLLGMKSATHTRFEDSDEEESNIITILDSDDEKMSFKEVKDQKQKQDVISLVGSSASSDSEDLLFSDDSSSHDNNETLHQTPKDFSNNAVIDAKHIRNVGHEEAPIILLCDDSSDDEDEVVIQNKPTGHLISGNSMTVVEKNEIIDKQVNHGEDQILSIPQIDQPVFDKSRREVRKDIGISSMGNVKESETKLSPRNSLDASQIDQPVFEKSGEEVRNDISVASVGNVKESETKLSHRNAQDDASQIDQPLFEISRMGIRKDIGISSVENANENERKLFHRNAQDDACQIDQPLFEICRKGIRKDNSMSPVENVNENETKLSRRNLLDDACQIDQPLYKKSEKEMRKDNSISPVKNVNENEKRLSPPNAQDDADDADNAIDHGASKTRISSTVEDCVSLNSSTAMSTKFMKFPILNTTQEKAAVSFLNSPSSTMSIVQGPPGTGKTTFLATVILRSFFESRTSGHDRSGPDIDRRVLVSAPTNRAVTVLASKVLDILNGDTSLNLVLVGVEDKLVLDDHNPDASSVDGVSEKSLASIRSIFAYTWVEDMTKKFASIQMDLRRTTIYKERKKIIFQRVDELVVQLKNNLPYWSGKCGVTKCIDDFFRYLNDGEKAGSDLEEHLEDATRSMAHAIQALKSINKMDSVEELLQNANIIFSTLTSSGGSPMRKTAPIDDLFIDEAAAATEPQMIIPFRLNPDRMLAVGDPKQLPATITSQRAISYGLSKSLLDRIMYDCGAEHIMLDVQYRMRPEISRFPSARFYGGKILDGHNVKNSNYKGNEAILNSKAYTFFNIQGRERQASSGSYYNQIEAQAIANIVQQIQRKTRLDRSSTPWYSSRKIRIITFYQAQVSCLRQCLNERGAEKVLVATVDSSQGCEADIVILSFVRSNQRAGFLRDDRRMNVALTRAKYQLICVGDVTGTLSVTGVNTLDALIADAKKRDVIRDFDHREESSTGPLRTRRYRR